jgi:hypothetical protein
MYVPGEIKVYSSADEVLANEWLLELQSEYDYLVENLSVDETTPRETLNKISVLMFHILIIKNLCTHGSAYIEACYSSEVITIQALYVQIFHEVANTFRLADARGMNLAGDPTAREFIRARINDVLDNPDSQS